MAQKSVPFELVVQEVQPAPDFFPAIDPATQVVAQGVVATYQISVSRAGEHSAPVVLSVTGLPEGTVAQFSVNPLLPGDSSVLSITTADLFVGVYALELVASDS